MTPEGAILGRITNWLKAMKLTYIRLALQPGVTAGWPDLLVLLPSGIPIFLEIKRPGKEPTPLQATRLEKLSDLGFHAGWFDNSHDAISAIADSLNSLAEFSHSRRGAKTGPEVSTLGTSALHAEGGGVPDHPPIGGSATGAGGT